MPFYEGIGLIAEKNAVVIDVGVAFTKVSQSQQTNKQTNEVKPSKKSQQSTYFSLQVGYAGEFAPRAVIPTPELPPLNCTDELYEALVAFIHQLYFKHLLVNPRDRRVVLVDSLLGKDKLICFVLS